MLFLKHKFVIIFFILILNSCTYSKKQSPINQIFIDAPDIVQIMNTNYTNTTIAQKDGYTYLKLPDNHKAYEELKKSITKYVTPKDKLCFQFVPNKLGLHITLDENTTESAIWKNLIGEKINVHYSSLNKLSWNMHRSHNRETVYSVKVSIDSKDYALLPESIKPYFNVPTLHTTLVLFRTDQANECLEQYHALAN